MIYDEKESSSVKDKIKKLKEPKEESDDLISREKELLSTKKEPMPPIDKNRKNGLDDIISELETEEYDILYKPDDTGSENKE